MKCKYKAVWNLNTQVKYKHLRLVLKYSIWVNAFTGVTATVQFIFANRNSTSDASSEVIVQWCHCSHTEKHYDVIKALLTL